MLAMPPPAAAQVGVVLSVQTAPPRLPMYAQPPMPEAGYIWTPGYWQWATNAGYYWVPGTWVMPPMRNVLWTPPYWGWSDGAYVFHAGYWGPRVGYYGGINYGHGYGGDGYQGGRWERGSFVYNRSANNFGRVRVTDAYRQPMSFPNHSQVSFAGGLGGVRAQPNERERSAERDNHHPETEQQLGRFNAAANQPGLMATYNNGRPEIAATARPGQFQGREMEHTQGAASPVAHADTHAPQHGDMRPMDQNRERERDRVR